VDARTAGDRGGSTLLAQSAWGDVSITAAGGSVTDGATDAAVDIYARSLRLSASSALGATVANVLGTEAVTLALLAGAGGINVLEATNVSVGTVGTVPAGRVQNDGSVNALGDAASLTGAVKSGGSLMLDTANGSNIDGFPQFAVTGTLSTGSTVNPLTGLYEQNVQISNPTGSTLDAVRVAIGNLPPGVTVANAAGTLGDGRQYVMFNQTLAPGQSATLTIEYRVPAGSQIPTAATFEVDVTGVQAAPSLAGGTLLTSGVQAQRQADNSYLLSIITQTGRTYYIQYSDDGFNWTTVLSPLTALSTNTAWLDQGPPKSFPEPGTTAQRLYRVFLMP
jgi:hypothetical protein